MFFIPDRAIAWREKMRKLTEKETVAEMRRTAKWKRGDGIIERTFKFETFMEAVAFMNRVFALAEEQGHHPNLENAWTKVKIGYTTHDSGGLTKKDFDMAARIDRIV